MTKAKLSQLKKFFSKYPTQKFKKNEIVFKPGDRFENIYFNKSGFGRAYTKSAIGESTLNLFKPLFALSIIHFFAEARNELYVQALTPAEVYVIPQKDFREFLTKNMEIHNAVMELFFSSLLLYLNNQGNIVSGNALSKVSSVLLQLVHDYGDIKNDQLVVNFPATHRIIANLVGLTRETTSVQMSKLQKLGVISTKRTQFTVRNLEKLKSLATTG